MLGLPAKGIVRRGEHTKRQAVETIACTSKDLVWRVCYRGKRTGGGVLNARDCILLAMRLPKESVPRAEDMVVKTINWGTPLKIKISPSMPAIVVTSIRVRTETWARDCRAQPRSRDGSTPDRRPKGNAVPVTERPPRSSILSHVVLQPLSDRLIKDPLVVGIDLEVHVPEIRVR